MNEELLYVNGVSANTGSYGLPPMHSEALLRIICRQPAPANLDDLRRRKHDDDRGSDRVRALAAELASARQRLQSLPPDSSERRACARRCDELQRELDLRRDHGVREGIDAAQLAQAGWGVVFAPGVDPAVREALQPLLSLRREQAGPLFRVYEGVDGYRLGESKPHFLARHGADASGPADPQRVPYYLLLVGDPEQIPFSFQYQLDVQYAVGRLHLQRPEEYASYARTVVEAETRGVPLPRRLSLFGVANPDDPATQLSLRHLVQPLREALRDNPYGYAVEQAPEASRARLQGLLGGAETPALLFTAGHGVEFASGDPRQPAHQGALLCQDWPGPSYRGAFTEDFYLAGEHLPSDASLRGMMVFGFACYGAGTPRLDEFAPAGGEVANPRPIAPRDFVASLPMRLLGHPRGGCLAFIGHIDRAWGYSYAWPRARGRSQTAAFESALRRLLQGLPVGYALEYFNERYAELSTMLTQQLQEIDNGCECDPFELAAMWTANNDARSYIVLGDPAARLRLAEQAGGAALLQEQPALSVSSPAPAPAPAPLLAPGAPRALEGVSEDDWARTPLAVQRAVLQLIAGRAGTGATGLP